MLNIESNNQPSFFVNHDYKLQEYNLHTHCEREREREKQHINNKLDSSLGPAKIFMT